MTTQKASRYHSQKQFIIWCSGLHNIINQTYGRVSLHIHKQKCKYKYKNKYKYKYKRKQSQQIPERQFIMRCIGASSLCTIHLHCTSSTRHLDEHHRTNTNTNTNMNLNAIYKKAHIYGHHCTIHLHCTSSTSHLDEHHRTNTRMKIQKYTAKCIYGSMLCSS